MAEAYRIIKNFQDWKGIHKGFSNFIRPIGFSDTADNVTIDENFDIIKSPGGKFITGQADSSSGDFRGIFGHVYLDKDNQQRKEELLLVNQTGRVYRKKEETLTLSYDFPAISVQRGQIQFGASEDTATATITSVDTSKAFVRITGTCHLPARETVSSSNLDNDDLGAYVELTDATTVTATRLSTGEDVDYLVNFEVWEYVGADGGKNEFKVLNTTVESFSTSSTTATFAISGHTDINDVVLFSGGATHTDTNSQQKALTPRLSIDTGTPQGEIEIGEAVSGNTLAVAISVVEFTGSAWSVQQITHTYSAAGADETEATSPTVTWAETFIISSHQSPDLGGSGAAAITDIVRPGTDGTTVRFRVRTGVGVTDRDSTAFLISNPNMSVTHDDSVTGGATNLPASTQTVNTTISAVTLANAGVVAHTEGSNGTQGAEAFWIYRLTSTTNLEMRSGNTPTVTVEWAYQIITMPTGDGPDGYAQMDFFPNSSGVWSLDLKENGSSISGFPKTYGTGLGYWADGTDELADLVSDINSEANYTASASNTLQFGAASYEMHASALPIQVDTEITESGVTITYFSFEQIQAAPLGVMLDGSIDNTLQWTDAKIVPEFVNPQGINLNNILYMIPFGHHLMKYDGNRFYAAGMPKTNFFNASPAGGGSLSAGDYTYHITYINKDKRGNIVESAPSDDQTVTLTAGQRGSLLIPALHATQNLGQLVSVAGSNTFIRINKSDYLGDGLGLKANDKIGIRESLATFPAYDIRTVSSIDKSNATYVQINLTSAIDTGGSTENAYFVSTPNSFDSANDDFVYPIKLNNAGALVDGSQSGVNTITVYANHSLQVGDVAYFYDDLVNEYTERNITATTATTITVDGDAVDVGNITDDYISNNSRIGIYRTKVNGVDKFLVAEIPTPVLQASGLSARGAGVALISTYLDDKPDNELKIKYIAPPRSPDPPPKCKFATVHQGLLILAGDPDNPNTVYFSEPGKPEAFPGATNSFIVEFRGEGSVTGLGVDNDILVVFKDDARAYVRGSLAENAFEAEIVEDGIGCPGHNSIVNTPAGLVFISNRGPQKSVNGLLDRDFAARLATDFKDQFYLQVSGTAISTENEGKFVAKRAAAINDFRRGKYICTIPKESGTPGSDGTSDRGPNSGTIIFVYDYKNDHFSFAPSNVFKIPFETQDPDPSGNPNVLNGYGGYTIHEGQLFFVHSGIWSGGAGFPERFGHVYEESLRTDKYAFSHHGLAIPFKVSTHWETDGEPSVFKKFLRSVAFISDPSLLADTFVLTVKAFKNFLSTTPTSQATHSFTTSTQEGRMKMIGQKAKSMKIEFSNEVLHEDARITGYEYELIRSYGTKIKE